MAHHRAIGGIADWTRRYPHEEGLGRYTNLGVGLVGALIGGFLFDVLSIDLGLANISVSLQDVVAAFVGSLLFLAVVFYGRRWHEGRGGKAKAERS